MFLQRFGTRLRCLYIKPMGNFFNLYEFMKILSQYSQHYRANPLRSLNRFDFSFGCRAAFHDSTVNNADDDGLVPDGNNQINNQSNQSFDQNVIGTGGKLLEALKELLASLIGLKHLALRDLLLNIDEAKHLLDDVAENCYEQLISLTLINCCKFRHSFLHAGIFINLKTLVITCQHLDEDLLMMLAYNVLEDLYIVQTEVTRSFEPISAAVWKRFTKANQHTKIHLVMSNKSTYNAKILNQNLVLQRTRIHSILFDAPIIRPTSIGSWSEIVRNYSDTLECLAFYQLPKYSICKSYPHRIDSILIYLSENCHRLQTLIINDLVSTATLLLIVMNLKNLRQLFVRKNAVRKRFDPPKSIYLEPEQFRWLRQASRSFERTNQEISRLLGFAWTPIPDHQFKQVRTSLEF
ncbi:beta-parvin-like [Sarcoptes scabiei]|nr:beta-parvin-like [Sarcoptes scabiei]